MVLQTLLHIAMLYLVKLTIDTVTRRVLPPPYRALSSKFTTQSAYSAVATAVAKRSDAIYNYHHMLTDIFDA